MFPFILSCSLLAAQAGGHSHPAAQIIQHRPDRAFRKLHCTGAVHRHDFQRVGVRIGDDPVFLRSGSTNPRWIPCGLISTVLASSSGGIMPRLEMTE